jgi:hypothetical protein
VYWSAFSNTGLGHFQFLVQTVKKNENKAETKQVKSKTERSITTGKIKEVDEKLNMGRVERKDSCYSAQKLRNSINHGVLQAKLHALWSPSPVRTKLSITITNFASATFLARSDTHSVLHLTAKMYVRHPHHQN